MRLPIPPPRRFSRYKYITSPDGNQEKWYNVFMHRKINKRGFTLLEILVAIGIFLIFAIGIYSGISMIFKIVYQSRMKILETAILSEQLEIARNLPYESVGIVGGLPSGLLAHEKTVTRNGKDFTVVTTVRNIDDAYDGSLGGAPNDTAPADYKLVEISAICQNCTQQKPIILSTIVAPKSLEGASDNGALFINVFDANGLPVTGANVHIVNTSPQNPLTVDDVTDNEGMLRLIDAPTGTLSYQITVTKGGYSTDQTINSSESNPNPLKPPANVVSKTITEISFAIDALGSLNLRTMNGSCSPIGGISFNINGEKVIGTNPNIYKYANIFSTDGNGDKSLAGLEWDKYLISLADTSYDIAGSVPILPLNLTPGLNQEMSLVLRAHSENSLLIKVLDAGTQLPLSDSTVRLTGTGYDQAYTTGLGYVRQTDWSGGGGQSDFLVEDRYFVDSGTLDTDSPAGDVKLKKVGGNYINSGWLESSTFDLGMAVNFNNIYWTLLAQPIKTGDDPLVFQLAAGDEINPEIWEYVGPDGTSATYYTATNNVIWSGLDEKRYLRYKAFFNTADVGYTPILSEVAFTYTNSCTPPGQSFFSELSAGTYNLEISRNGYATNSGTIEVSGNSEITINLSTQD